MNGIPATKARSDGATKGRRFHPFVAPSLRRSVASPPAFTLVEMLLASVLAAILMAAVLTVAATLARDQKRMESRQSATHTPTLFDLLRRDLTNAAALLPSSTPDTLELLSHAALDPKTLAPTQRLAHIRYYLARQGRAPGALLREQRFLDDPIRPQPFSEILATRATRLSLTPISLDADPVRLGDEVGARLRVPTATRVPSRLVLRIEFPDSILEHELVLR